MLKILQLFHHLKLTYDQFLKTCHVQIFTLGIIPYTKDSLN